MYLKAKVRECDFTGEKYDEPVDGAHCFARGATGRWCCVMYMGPAKLRESGIEPLSEREFIAAWEQNPHREPHDYLEM